MAESDDENGMDNFNTRAHAQARSYRPGSMIPPYPEELVRARRELEEENAAAAGAAAPGAAMIVAENGAGAGAAAAAANAGLAGSRPATDFCMGIRRAVSSFLDRVSRRGSAQ